MPKLLREFLLEQQEPFSLNTYLSERGFPRRNRPRVFEESSCADFAKTVFCRLISRKSDIDKGEIIHTEVDESSSLNISSSIPENHVSFKTTRGEPSSSSSSTSVFQERDMSESFDLYAVNKRVMRQRKHLLVDCVREVIEKHRKNGGREKILGTDELWKLVCENVWLWSQDSICEANVDRVIGCDLMETRAREWDLHHEGEKEEMYAEIGNAILDGIIGEQCNDLMVSRLT